MQITALRLSNVIVDPTEYLAFPDFDADSTRRSWNLWGYIDARDAAQAVEKALSRSGGGFERYLIAAADTVMSRENDDLVAELFPATPKRHPLGANDTLLSIEKARRELGYEPLYSWRDSVG